MLIFFIIINFNLLHHPGKIIKNLKLPSLPKRPFISKRKKFAYLFIEYVVLITFKY